MRKALCALILGLNVVALRPAFAQSDAAVTASPEQIQGWVTKLESDNYSARSVATERLILAGSAAIEPVAAAAETGGLETIIRGIYILRQLAIAAKDPDTQVAAYDALERLSDRRITTASRRAASAMMSIDETRQRQAQLRLEQLGAVITMTHVQVGPRVSHPFPAVQFGESWRGSLKDLEQLRWLTNSRVAPDTPKWMIAMHGERVADDWMKPIAPLDNVAVIQLNSTSVTDAGIARLREMGDLQYVELLYTPVSDDSLRHLKAIPSLQRVKIYGTKVSAAAASSLQDELVNVEVDHRKGGFLGIGCEDNPCRVTQVREETAAAKAGLQFGDIITHFNGQAVNTMDELTERIAQNAAGDSVTVYFQRGTEKFEREVVLGRWE